MTKKFTYTQKSTGDALSATEWNNLAQDVDAAVDAINNGGVGGGSEYVSLSNKNNVEITSPKHINIEPSLLTYENSEWSGNAGDIQLKPGDDISLYSSHRGSKTDEVSVKVLDDSDHPVKLQIQAGEITLLAKQKNLTKAKDSNTGAESENEYQYNDDLANVFDINVTTEYKPNRGTGSKKSGKGYLKVRAQAIDLRCELNGGIALQPKGEDGQGHMNKIKFEHGGGDGLEFGTFNTEHTSLFTGDYRFNKDGVIRLATRTTTVSDKADANDSTTAYKYVKAADDFYDNIDQNDQISTWKGVVKAGALFDDIDSLATGSVTQPSTGEETSAIIAKPYIIFSLLTAQEHITNNNLIGYDIDAYPTLGGDDWKGAITIGHKYDASEMESLIGSITHALSPHLEGYVPTFPNMDPGVHYIKATVHNDNDDTTYVEYLKFEFHKPEIVFTNILGENESTNLSDIIKLVRYMKSNQQGPWASN